MSSIELYMNYRGDIGKGVGWGVTGTEAPMYLHRRAKPPKISLHHLLSTITVSSTPSFS